MAKVNKKPTSLINLDEIAVGEPQKITADLKPFDKAKEQVNLTITELNKFLTISTKETLDLAMDTLKLASKVEKAIESKRKELVKPFNDGAGAINAYAKEITEGLPKAISDVKAVALAYQKAEEEKAAKLIRDTRIQLLGDLGLVLNETGNRYELGEVEVTAACLLFEDQAWNQLIDITKKRLQEQASAKLTELEQDDDLRDIMGYEDKDIQAERESIAAIADVPALPSTALHTPSKLSGTAKVWKFEVIDADQVPRKYLAIDETAIRRAVAAGERSIAGVRIYEDTQLRIR